MRPVAISKYCPTCKCTRYHYDMHAHISTIAFSCGTCGTIHTGILNKQPCPVCVHNAKRNRNEEGPAKKKEDCSIRQNPRDWTCSQFKNSSKVLNMLDELNQEEDKFIH